jgi:hypothetical protein
VSDHLHPAQIEAFRRMTPAQKLALAAQLWFEARELKAAALRARHPEWTEDEVQRKVRDVFLHAAD